MKPELMDATPCGCVCQPSVWMQMKIFVSWVKQFIFHTKASEKNVKYEIILPPPGMQFL